MAEEKQIVKKTETPITEMVLSRVTDLTQAGGLNLPTDYSAPNAVRSAFLIISELKDSKTNIPVTQSCTRDSIYNALFTMVTQGLNPAKKQCSFIQYGNKLTMQREYAGSIALARRYGNLKDIQGVVIYEGDELELQIDVTTGRRRILKHIQKFEHIDNDKIKGAYAIITFNDGSYDTEVMTMAQIKKAWDQGPTKGTSPAHKNFPDQMAIKTVINRATKILISSSDDSVLMEPGEDGRIPRNALATATTEDPITPQVIDIPEEHVQVAEEVKEETVATEKAPF